MAKRKLTAEDYANRIREIEEVIIPRINKELLQFRVDLQFLEAEEKARKSDVVNTRTDLQRAQIAVRTSAKELRKATALRRVKARQIRELEWELKYSIPEKLNRYHRVLKQRARLDIRVPTDPTIQKATAEVKEHVDSVFEKLERPPSS